MFEWLGQRFHVTASAKASAAWWSTMTAERSRRALMFEWLGQRFHVTASAMESGAQRPNFVSRRHLWSQSSCSLQGTLNNK